MSTSFDRDNADHVKHLDTTHNDDDISSLPVDAQDLYHRLSREGAAMRERLARIDQRLQEHVAQLSATHIAPTLESDLDLEPASRAMHNAPSAPLWSPTAGRVRQRAPRYPTVRRWATLLATCSVVVAFIAVFTVNSGSQRSASPSRRHTPTAAASPTSAPTSHWEDLKRLDYSTSFSANGLPAVAPSNPQVVYETMVYSSHVPGPAKLRATDDGGVTWRTLPTPVPADHISWASIIVSPLNPETVFLDLMDNAVADCPPTSEVNSVPGFTPNCEIQYTSFDGGAQWALTAPTLPTAYGSKSGGLSAGISSGLPASFSIPIEGHALGAQGQRLYSGAIYSCPNVQGNACIRLMTSDDGGHTWHFADLPLIAGGAANVCDYAASVSGADLYAVTAQSSCAIVEQAARTLWHSVDAGATWVKVRQLATPNEQGLVLAHDATTGATLLYTAEPVTTSYTQDKMGGSVPVVSEEPSDVKVSTDGGATWQSAPRRGIPSDHEAYFGVGVLGPLSDGSVVLDVISPSTIDPNDNFQGSDLYAWKPGDSGWRLIGSVSQEMDGLLVIPSPTGGGDSIYAFLTTRNDINTFTILEKHVVP